jgi:hypothetical protein
MGSLRSPREIAFRLRQELANLAMLAVPPRDATPVSPRGAGVPEALRETAHAAEVVSIADSILAHRFPLLGVVVETGPEIDWRRDYLHGVSTGTDYFRRVPYLAFSRVGDHKAIWELNRHQHLVVLAQAFHFTGRREYLDEAFRQIESWIAANPFLRGINWASALEVAFRALSWSWLWNLAGREMGEPLRSRFLAALYQHGCYLEHNLSVYFSPNTHLLGEAVALHALGAWFPEWRRAARWRDVGGRIVEEEMRRQVRDDGSHFEQSVYYHVYALDLFLLHRLLAECPAAYDERLIRMADYLHSLMGPDGTLPLIGDDDGGRVFHPYGDRLQFGRATMATCAALFDPVTRPSRVDPGGSRYWRPEWLRSAEDLHSQAAWWVGPRALSVEPAASASHASRLFADAGVAVMTAGDSHIVVKAGGFGEGSGGHSHSDVLSVVVRRAGEELLIDPGTFTYISDPVERDRFRGSAAHNTVRIDGRDQAVPAGPFRWDGKPEVRILNWSTAPERDSLEASCSYAGFTHRRRIALEKPATVVILDTIEGPRGEHIVEQFWQLGGAAQASRLSISEPLERIDGWRSRAFASREATQVVRVAVRGPLPVRIAAVLDLSDTPRIGPVTTRGSAESGTVNWSTITAEPEVEPGA